VQVLSCAFAAKNHKIKLGQMVITSELGGCALQPAATLASLHLGLVTSGGYNPELRGEYFA